MTHDLHSLMAPYVLGALDPDERALLVAHLDQCATCEAELTGFRDTAARLGASQSRPPPLELRARLLAEVSVTPQEHPAMSAIDQRRGLLRTFPRLLVAAALLLGVAGIGGYVVELGHAHDSDARLVAMTSVLAAPDAATTSKTFSSGGNLRLVASPSRDSAVIVANDLAVPKGSKVYQVWMINDAGARSQGTFRSSGSLLMDGAGGADSVAVTVEPAGGSPRPTGHTITTIDV